MRNCPACLSEYRSPVWYMEYKTPDGWPLPSEIVWYTCSSCGLLYGDGPISQSMFNEYYQRYYGYGINSPDNKKRLMADADEIARMFTARKDAVIVDFGGGGDDGRSIIVDALQGRGYLNAVSVGVNDEIPKDCDLIYASHVLEHIYNLPEIMRMLLFALRPEGTLVVDGPDSTGILLKWDMPMMDFNTKHLNHFTLRDYLNIGHKYGLEAMDIRSYKLSGAPAFHIQFKRLNMAEKSAEHVKTETTRMLDRLYGYAKNKTPVNIWGMGDITWHLLSRLDLNVMNYIDNDPAYRGQTYKGQLVLERPDNNEPILILAQGQKKRLIENIRKMGVKNQIVEI